MIFYINNYEEGAGNTPLGRRTTITHHHMKKETIEAIFHDWRPREILAMQRATAWLRAMQSEEWQYQRQQIVNEKHPIKPLIGIR